MAVAQLTAKSGFPITRPLEGGLDLYTWSGTITVNFLDSTNQAEINRYARDNANTTSVFPTAYQGISPEWRAQIQSAAAIFSRYANISFEFNDDINANYLVGDVSGQGLYGYWSFPENSQLNAGFGVNASGMQPAAEQGGGSDRLYTFVHELGHAVGLSHPHDSNNNPPIGTNTQSPPPYTALGTVMSYDITTMDGVQPSSAYGLPVTPMALDIAALQRMYGAASTYTTNTAYALTDARTSALDLNGDDGSISVGRAYYSIWDSGGTGDRITYSGQSNTLINLNAATLDLTSDPAPLSDLLSEISSSQAFSRLDAQTRTEITGRNYHSGGFFSSILTTSGDRIAGGYTIANGAIIEEARGGSGDDMLIGNEYNNRLFGGRGNDALYGGNGADYLDLGGRSGSNSSIEYAYGGNGSDYIVGGETSATIVGGAGDDYYDIRMNFMPASRPVEIELQLAAGWGHDYIERQTVTVDGNTYSGTGVSRVRFTDLASSAVSFVWGRHLVQVSEFEVYVRGQVEQRRVESWSGDMVLVTASGDSLFLGNATGELDTAGSVAGAFSVTLSGQAGELVFTDRTLPRSFSQRDAGYSWASFQAGSISAYTGAKAAYEAEVAAAGVPFIAPPESVRQTFSNGSSPTVRGTGQRDRIFGTDADEFLDGLEDDDVLQAGGGNDLLAGGQGDDVLEGGTGLDTLQGGDGSDELSGGSDNDLLEGGDGDDLIQGNEGSDTASYSSATSGVRVDLSLSQSQGTGGSGSDTLIDVEGLIGSGFDDYLMDGASASSMAGGLGVDTFYIHGLNSSTVIQDFDALSEKIEFRAGLFANLADVLNAATQVGNDVVIHIAGSADILLRNVSLQDLSANTFVVPPPPPTTIDKPDILKGAEMENYDANTALSVVGYDLIRNANITLSETLPHATVVATAGGGGDEFYAVHAEAGSRGIFDIDGAGFDSILTLFDGSGNVIAENDDSYSDAGSSYYNSLIDYTLTTGGDYYIRVSSYDTPGQLQGGASYTLNVSLEGAPVEY